MAFCEKCGAQLSEGAKFCAQCGASTAPAAEAVAAAEAASEAGFDAAAVKEGAAKVAEKAKKLPKWAKIVIPVAVVVILLVIIIAAAAGDRCEKDGCKNEPVSGSEYCSLHKCTLSSCDNMRTTGSTYCYTHKKALDSIVNNSKPSASNFKLSNVKVTHNSSYTVCTGTLTNTSSKTFTFVKLKGAFQNSSGITLDTDWTYAVGAEGLSPKESCTFRMSVPKNTKITKCSISLIN